MRNSWCRINLVSITVLDKQKFALDKSIPSLCNVRQENANFDKLLELLKASVVYLKIIEYSESHA